MMARKKIIIVGGGVAGLYAAALLSKESDLVVLEARNVLGGRIRTVEKAGFSTPIEAGAEFVHGNLPLTMQLLQEAAIEYTAVQGKMYYVTEGIWKEEEMFVNGWDTAIKKMQQLKEDMPLFHFLQDHFGGEEHASLRAHMTRFAEGFDLADPANASVKALCKEWSADEEQNYRVPGGYCQLIDHLAVKVRENGGQLLTSHIVSTIHWKKEHVILKTVDGLTFDANCALITIPGNLLADPARSITITPLPSAYLNAMQNIGSGNVIKIVMEFHKRRWKEDAGFIFTAQKIPTWWTTSPDTRPLLIGWLGGPRARFYSHASEAAILNDAILSLANIFSVPVEEIRQDILACQIYNWQNEPFAEVAYSYATPQSAAARTLLSEPLNGTLYFAGEYLNKGAHPGTVEAALESGKQTALKILEKIRE